MLAPPDDRVRVGGAGLDECPSFGLDGDSGAAEGCRYSQVSNRFNVADEPPKSPGVLLCEPFIGPDDPKAGQQVRGHFAQASTEDCHACIVKRGFAEFRSPFQRLAEDTGTEKSQQGAAHGRFSFEYEGPDIRSDAKDLSQACTVDHQHLVSGMEPVLTGPTGYEQRGIL